MSVVVGNVASFVNPSQSSPNALGYNAATRMLYLCSFTGSFSRLFRFSVETGDLAVLGDLNGLAGGATFFEGSYWYTEQRSDRLHRVILNSSTGLVTEDVVIANMTGGTKVLDYGDIDFDPQSGLVIISCVVFSNGGTRELATYNIATGVYTVLWSGISTDPLNQIAVADDGSIVNHQTSSGNLMTVSRTGIFSPSFATSVGFTDIALIKCPPVFP